MVLKIENGRVITDKVETDKALYIGDGKILAVTNENLPADKVLDAKGAYVSPGFVDLHVHGGGGTDFTDGTTEAVRTAIRTHAVHGTTAIMPTVVVVDRPNLRQALYNIGTVMREKDESLSQILGTHIEGPYFSLEQAGAVPPAALSAPVKDEYENLLREFKGVIRRWSFAPEKEGAVEFCNTLLENGVIPSIAHTNATYEEILPVYRAGCRLMTHFYSGMSLLTRKKGFRVLGAVETGYLLDDMYVETIADGKHLPKELLRLICKVKTTDYICMVTDAILAAGIDGKTGLVDESRMPIVEDGVARTPDRMNFAGSIATADRLVRVMHKEVGIDIVNAVKMMTRIPAKLAGLGNIGEIKAGLDADIVIFDDDIKVQKVYLKGREIKCG